MSELKASETRLINAIDNFIVTLNAELFTPHYNTLAEQEYKINNVLDGIIRERVQNHFNEDD